MREWALQYGPIFHLRIGPQDVIVVNTAEAADELFITRSSQYSGRVSPHVAHDIMSDGQRLGFLPYGKDWKTARRELQGVIGPTPSKTLKPIQDLESRVLMYDLLCSNSWGDASVPVETSRGGFHERHWSSLVRRFTTSVVVNLTYGQRVHRLDGFAKLHKIYDVIENVSRVAQPGNYLADTFPVLRLLPDMLAPWRREGRRMHEWEMELFGSLLKEEQAALEKGVILPGFVNQYLRSRADATTEVTSGNGTTEDR